MKHLKESSILKLVDEDNKTYIGHQNYVFLLEKGVASILSGCPGLDKVSQEVLLKELEPVFTQEDNESLLALPTKDEVFKVVSESNCHGAPGCDGLTNFLYKECWYILGDSLTELVVTVHRGASPSQSQRTSLMIFRPKPKKLLPLIKIDNIY